MLVESRIYTGKALVKFYHKGATITPHTPIPGIPSWTFDVHINPNGDYVVGEDDVVTMMDDKNPLPPDCYGYYSPFKGYLYWDESALTVVRTGEPKRQTRKCNIPPPQFLS